MNFKQNIKHWMKVDHITFLLIAPAIILDYSTTALVLWTTAFLYDIYEGYTKKEK